MSICLSGQQKIDPDHNQAINDNTQSQRNDIVHISGVFLERIEENTIQRKRKKRGNEEISNKNNFFKTLRKVSMKRHQDSSRFFDISTHENNKEIKDRECVDDVVHCVHGAHAQCTSIDISCRNKEFPLVQLQDQYDVHTHKKHRSKHDGKHEDRQSFEKVCSI